MPGIYHQPIDRRGFLRTITFGGAAVALVGCQSVPREVAASRELHLALLADTHIPGDRLNGHRGFNPWEHLRQAVPQVAATRPEGVVICGDAARLEGKLEDYRELKELLAPLAAATPVYIGLGNHDDRANFRKVFPGGGDGAPQIPDRHVMVIEHAVVRIVILDSLLNVNKVEGLLGQRQRAWLAGYLPRAADRPVVLMVHHTLGDGDGDLLDADRLFALIRPHRQVKAVFYGHSHVWSLAQRQGVRLVNLPAVGYNFRDQDPVGWVTAKFQRDGVLLTLHAFAGQRSEDGRTTRIRWA